MGYKRFLKNDAFKTPKVLYPLRNEGIINVNIEIDNILSNFQKQKRIDKKELMIKAFA